MQGIAERAYAPYVERMGGRRPGPMDADYASLVTEAETWVAEDDGEIIGLLVLVHEADGMLLDGVAVLPSSQGLGTGRALLTLAEERARAAGHRRIRLYTHVTMVENQRLYERMGYVETRRSEEHGFARVFYEKRLPGPIRMAGVDDADVVAELLDAFNREFASPTPGVAVLTARLRELLAAPAMFALLAGEPAIGIALVSLRPSAWYDGPAALLDELYVAPERRGAGIGGDLLAAVEVQVRRRGGGVLEINVDGEDVDARRFYVRHGYTDTDVGQSEPCLYFHKELDEGER